MNDTDVTCVNCGKPATVQFDGEDLCERCSLMRISRADAAATAALEVLSAAVTAALVHADGHDVLTLVSRKVVSHQAPLSDDDVMRLREQPPGLPPQPGTLADIHHRLHTSTAGEL